ncbi:dephospho-CoA kinase, partial [Paenibacillus darwinianus]
LVDADRVASEVVLPGEPALAAVAGVFGQVILHEDGTLNRAKLGEIAFADSDKLRTLESILHPAIRTRMWEQMNRTKADEPGRLIVADIPLLYETNQQDLYGGVLVVYVPRQVQLARLLSRNPGLTREQALQRIEAQMDIERKKSLADWVIDNSGTITETERQVEAFWNELGRA